jgi:hypothetical protein
MSWRRDLLLCFSFANLCFLDSWDASPHVVPLLIAIAIFGLVFWGVGRIVGKCGPWIALFGLLFPLNLIRVHALHLTRRDIGIVVPIVAAVAVAFAVFRWRKQVLRVPGLVALVMIPLLPIQLGYIAWRHVTARETTFDPARPPDLVDSVGKTRVVWIIFDELDEDIAFDHRPASLSLPQFERLRHESLFSDRGIAPASTTRQSVPTLLGDIFMATRKAHQNAAIVGSELPYGFMFRGVVASLEAMPSAATELAATRPTMLDRTWHYLYTRLYPRRPLFDAETRRLSRQSDMGRFESLRHWAEERAIDTRYQLVYIHLPIPHLLGMWDRRAGKFSTSDSSSYLDNLALADRTLGQIRGAMETAGVWDKTTLIVSSDHPLRDFIIEAAGWWNDAETAALPHIDRKYVPFILKLPGQPHAELHTPIKTVHTRDLVLAVLDGRVTTNAQAEALLTRDP